MIKKISLEGAKKLATPSNPLLGEKCGHQCRTLAGLHTCTLRKGHPFCHQEYGDLSAPNASWGNDHGKYQKPPNPAVRGDCKAGVPCTGVVRRVSDGKILPVIGESKGADLDEILVVQAFPFWSPTGTVMKPMKMWQPRSRYEPYIRTANPKIDGRGTL